jgi:hypothetical protein
MVTQVRYSVAGRSRGGVVSCAVCTVHVETRRASFLVERQNQGRRFVSGLASKPLGRFLIGLCLKTDGDGLSVVWSQNNWDGFSSVWPSKSMSMVCEWFDFKTTQTIFTGFASKLMVGFLVEPQNQAGGGFPSLGLKTGNFGLVICASKSLRRFIGLDLKTRGLQFVGCAIKLTEEGRRGTRVEI